MGWSGHGWGMGGWAGGIFMVLFWILVIVGIVMVVRNMMAGGMRSAAPGQNAQDPLDILKERYARGEIDTEEFEERKKALDGG